MDKEEGLLLMLKKFVEISAYGMYKKVICGVHT
jgi:hypothetical protein